MLFSTERLLLREFTPHDANFLIELVTDPDWIRFIGDTQVLTVDDAKTYIERRLMAMYHRLGFGLWLVERSTDQTPVGMCGLVKRDSLADVDVGFAFARAHRGHGYALEAAQGTVKYAEHTLGLRRLVAITSPDNERSARLLKTLGMTLEQRYVLPGETRETCRYAMALPERPETDDSLEIDLLVRRFFAAFTNRGGPAPLASLAEVCHPSVQLISNTGVVPEVFGLAAFIAPRQALLTDGRLTEFEEFEMESETAIHGRLAHRRSRYRKSGVLNGTPLEGGGNKVFQLVKSSAGWRIASVAWEDFT